MKISIVIPCYNEAENVTSLQDGFFPVILEILRSNSPQQDLINIIEVIFVDDGSTDDTFSLLRDNFGALPEPGIHVKFERHEINRGLGAALRTGFYASSGDVVITTDSDSTYKYCEIPRLLACLSPEVDIVTASPYHPSGEVVGVPAYRLILSRGSSFLYRILVDWHIHTYTSLFRAYRRKVIEDITFEANGFLAGTELMVKAIFKGYHVAEYPTALYRRTYGVSKAKLLRTILAHLRFQAQVLFYRLRIRSLSSKDNHEGEKKWKQSAQSFPGADQK